MEKKCPLDMFQIKDSEISSEMTVISGQSIRYNKSIYSPVRMPIALLNKSIEVHLNGITIPDTVNGKGRRKDKKNGDEGKQRILIC